MNNELPNEDYVGGLFGSINGGAVRNLGVKGKVAGSTYVGGVAYALYSGSIVNCFAAIEVKGKTYVGGIAGVLSGSNIINCYVTGAVSGSSAVGGVVGAIGINTGNVTNCYVTAAVSGNSATGGIGAGNATSCAALNPSISRASGSNKSHARVKNSGNITNSNNVAWKDMAALGGIAFSVGSANNKDGADVTAAQAKTQKIYEDLGWKFGKDDDNPWKMGVGEYGLPVFFWQTAAPAAMPAHLK